MGEWTCDWTRDCNYTPTFIKYLKAQVVCSLENSSFFGNAGWKSNQSSRLNIFTNQWECIILF